MDNKNKNLIINALKEYKDAWRKRLVDMIKYQPYFTNRTQDDIDIIKSIENNIMDINNLIERLTNETI